jgi:hypothetical protein
MAIKILCLCIWIYWFFYGLFGNDKRHLKVGCIFGALLAILHYIEKIFI